VIAGLKSPPGEVDTSDTEADDVEEESDSGTVSGAEDPKSDSTEEEDWSPSKLAFYQGKYNDGEEFLRKGYQNKKGSGAKESLFWDTKWKDAKYASNTAKKASELAAFQKAIGALIVGSTKEGNPIYRDVTASLYADYNEKFSWRLVKSRKLAPSFPVNVSFDEKEYFAMPPRSSVVATSDADIVMGSDNETKGSKRQEKVKPLYSKEETMFVLDIAGTDHLMVKQVGKGDGFGLFCAGHFYAGVVVTFFFGPIVFTSPRPGQALPSQRYVRAKVAGKCEPTDRLVVMRDLEGRPYAVCPKYPKKPIDVDGEATSKDEDKDEGVATSTHGNRDDGSSDEDGDKEVDSKKPAAKNPKEAFPYFYLGAHFIRDPMKGCMRHTDEWVKARKSVNAKMLEDGTIVATKEIKYGEEILLRYDEMPDLVYEGKFDERAFEQIGEGQKNVSTPTKKRGGSKSKLRGTMMILSMKARLILLIAFRSVRSKRKEATQSFARSFATKPGCQVERNRRRTCVCAELFMNSFWSHIRHRRLSSMRSGKNLNRKNSRSSQSLSRK
jgi:hypothetical protein